MRRRIARPFGSSISLTRGFSLLIGLAVLGLLYDTFRQPVTWNWLAANDDRPVPSSDDGVSGPAAEVPYTIVPGPNDLDPVALAEFQARVGLITDRAELRAREMVPYWQLMAWSRSQSLPEFEKRAQPEPALTQLWEMPQEYRGKPIRLRMHIRRVLQYKAPENPLGLEECFEAWGWTEESKSHPYVVVFPEKPAGLPVGPAVEADVVFVGYFLKNMAYTAFDKSRAAPLLVGQLRMAKPPQAAAPLTISAREKWALALGGLAVAVVILAVVAKGRKRRSTISNSNPLTPLPDARWNPVQEIHPSEPFEFSSAIAGVSNQSQAGLQSQLGGQ